jgi:predicted heme/steroid binding protein
VARSTSSVTSAENTNVYVNHSNSISAISATGDELWSYEFDSRVVAQATIDDNGLIYAVTKTGLSVFDPQTQQINWQFNTTGDNNSPAIIGKDGTVYLTSKSMTGRDGKLYAIDPSGQQLWDFSYRNSINSGVSLSDDDTVFVGAANKLFALDLQGQEKWHFVARSVWVGPPAISDNGTLYFGSRGYAYALNTEHMGLAQSAWPRDGQNNHNTSRQGTQLPAGIELPLQVNAGSDETMPLDTYVSLDGTAVNADAGAQYLWQQRTGPTVTLVDPQTLQAGFTTPKTKPAEPLSFSLSVTNADGQIATDSVVIFVDAGD